MLTGAREKAWPGKMGEKKTKTTKKASYILCGPEWPKVEPDCQCGENKELRTDIWADR